MIVVSLTEMKVSETSELQPEDTQHEDNGEFNASDVLNSTEVAGDNQNMFGYIQDNFEFLDQMDCSGMDHMDCSVSYQVCFLWLQIFLSTQEVGGLQKKMVICTGAVLRCICESFLMWFLFFPQ